jgi:hypothetical protein
MGGLYLAIYFALVLGGCPTKSLAKDIVVGENQGGWTLGVDYPVINAQLGDQLVSQTIIGTIIWVPGDHR